MKDIFDDKFFAYFFATIIVSLAMYLKLPGAEALANILLGGMFGAAIGRRI